MAKIWSSHFPSNWFFLNHNQCAQRCSLSNFTILGVFHSPLFLEMAKTWPFYGQDMVLTWFFLNLNQCAQGGSMPNFTLLGVSGGPLL